MPAPLNLPKTFPTDDPARLKDTLERFAQELDKFIRQLPQAYAPILSGSTPNPSVLKFGEVARVSIQDGDSVSLQLPKPDKVNNGKRCAIRRATITGEILVIPVGGALVGGAASYRLANDVHFVEFLLDDGDFYPSRAGAGD
jgi:hypothetical protein